jgi:hypothetical protein
MSCPICGARCKCKNAGPGGICCACHRHKPRPLKPDFVLVLDRPEWDEATREAVKRHRENQAQEEEEKSKQTDFFDVLFS